MARRFIRAANWNAIEVLVELVNDLARTQNIQTSTIHANQVLRNDGTGTAGRTGVDIAADANAEDVQFDNAIWYQINGQTYYKAVDAAVDISAECVGAGDTISTSGSGTLWLFVNTAGTVDGDTANGSAENESSAIATLAQYSIASNTLPPGADDVCVGCIQVTEGGSGAFTWGTDSIAAETETYYSFEGLPGIEAPMDSFALDAGAATFTYGAVELVLGSGTRVAATGKANVSLNGTDTISRGSTGAYLFYVLADDTEIAVLQSASHANLQAAKDAVRDLTPNPLLPLVGVIYITARKQDFVAGTTNLDAAGIDTEFVTYGPGTNQVEHGRDALGSFFAAVDDIDTQEGIL